MRTIVLVALLAMAGCATADQARVSPAAPPTKVSRVTDPSCAGLDPAAPTPRRCNPLMFATLPPDSPSQGASSLLPTGREVATSAAVGTALAGVAAATGGTFWDNWLP